MIPEPIDVPTPSKSQLHKEDNSQYINSSSYEHLTQVMSTENRLDALRPVFGYQFNSYGAGLKNMGNTCYLN